MYILKTANLLYTVKQVIGLVHPYNKESFPLLRRDVSNERHDTYLVSITIVVPGNAVVAVEVISAIRTLELDGRVA